jgi:hypothetical protein
LARCPPPPNSGENEQYPRRNLIVLSDVWIIA